MNPEYNELIARVRSIDPEAADYLLYEAPKLSVFYPEYDLGSCFPFSNSLQGNEYWLNILNELVILQEEMERKGDQKDDSIV